MEARRSRFLDVLYPRRCPACGDIVRPKGELICPECRERFSYVAEPTCLRCGKEILEPEMEYCYDCTAHTRSFDGGVALLNYDQRAKESIQGFKYGGRPEYADFYSAELMRRYGKRLRRWRIQAIFPVPVHRSRERTRGYNQAEVLAERIGELLDIPVWKGVLVRKKKTMAQKELNAEARQRNLEQAMEIEGDLRGLKRILLVDDIYTTGSTAEACTKVLKREGVERVYLACVCIGKN
ncbi:double zinc ribbon domain-containing protein [Hominifimenecus sp. rT4P-3]|uniref:ComF family protein n=1 Tax=Hominifimenecus sp. rT4P-3 TaxID=3242979 RepID=UPI003DA3107C